MSQISTVRDILTLSVISPARDFPPTRPWVRFRGGPARPGARVGPICPEVRGADASATSPLVPVAIDSETGQPCCLNAKKASLLRRGRDALRVARPRKRENGAPEPGNALPA